MRRIAAREGVGCWLVGGAVRDALLGREVFDVDAAVSGQLDSVARSLEAEGEGRAVALSDANPRAIRLAGRRALDLVEAEGGSIARDLARRDFTVNALALDLNTGELIDPHGGTKDLRRAVLRLLSEANLADDPLRSFRAARFIATHGLRPDSVTARACRRHGARLEEVAPERITAELRRILESPRVAEALRWAASQDLVGPALRLSSGQVSPRRLRSRLQALDAPAVLRKPPERRVLLRLALLADAFGLSPQRAGTWLRQLRHARHVTGEVVRLLELGQRARAGRGDDEAWRWIRDAGALWREALLVAVRGDRAESGRPRQLANRARRARRGLQVRGGDLLRWTGMPEGPRVGELLAELEVEILRGRVGTRGEARRWAAGRVGRTLV